MPILTLDERRRITLPKDVVEDSEQQFVAIKTKDGILLKTLPKDPIAALQKEGEKLKGISRKGLRKMAYEEALKEAGK
ncbi:MAG: AbrB family transcriptional regulator [Candidatus Aenigmarchaeota archaeon]|nr:AbrB family transcriptional regulator [Candidatus Aenigmarchaeota archaeon]